MRGQEGQHEKKVLQKIVAVQSLARGLQKQRENEQELFQRAPSKLVVPSKDTPSSMFEPSTWAMAFPELFPWGDGVPFLKRDIALTAEEVFHSTCYFVKNCTMRSAKNILWRVSPLQHRLDGMPLCLG